MLENVSYKKFQKYFQNLINNNISCISESSRKTFHWHVNFADPDLTITVDLEREEQEKNGRREYNYGFKSCLRIKLDKH